MENTRLPFLLTAVKKPTYLISIFYNFASEVNQGIP